MKAAAFETLDGYRPLLLGGIRVLILLAAGYLVTLILNRVIRAIGRYSVHVMTRQNGVLEIEAEKRAATVTSVIRRTLLTLLWVALAMMSLQELGFKIDALLAGAGISAGIIGVAVGFGAQNLVKDVIAGLFMLIENQIRVNDVAVINGTGGSVEQINLRTTVLRAENGAVYIFPNGSIQTLANLTRDFSFYVLEISINYDQDEERALEIMRDTVTQMRAVLPYSAVILGDLDVMGVDRLTVAGLVLKARIKTLPTQQWLVGREINRRLRTAFATAGITLGTAPVDIRIQGTPPKPLV